MARQHKNWPSHPSSRAPWSASGRTLTSIATASLGGLALFILLGKLDGPSALLSSNLICAAAREALGLLPSIVPAAWQAIHAYAFDDRGASACPVEILVSFLPLVRAVANVAGGAGAA